MSDSVLMSLVRGRVGSAVLSAAAAALTVYGVTAEEQQVLFQAATALVACVASVMSIVSKWRSAK